MRFKLFNTWATPLILGGIFLLPSISYAAVVQYTNTPVDASNVNVGSPTYRQNTPQIGIFQGQLTIPDPFNLAGLRFYGLAKPTDTSMRMRMVNPSSTFIDCQTEWFDPTARLPIWAGGSPPTSTEIRDQGETITLTFTGSQCSVGTATGYFMYGEREDNPGVQENSQLWIAMSQWDSNYSLYEISDTPFPPDNETTRIISHDPPNDDYLSTSTQPTITVVGFINPEDFEEGKYRFRTTIGRRQQALAAGPGWTDPSVAPNYEEYIVPIVASGEFTFSTTTTRLEAEGSYAFRSYIEEVPGFWAGLLNLPSRVIRSYTTRFAFGLPTAADLWIDTQVEIGEDFVNNLGVDPLSECQFDIMTALDFSSDSNLLSCLMAVGYTMVVPDATQMTDLVTSARDGFLTRFPWGYGTRIYDIFTADYEAAERPSLAFTLPGGLPVSGTWDFMPLVGLFDAVDMVNEYTDPEYEIVGIDAFYDDFYTWWVILWSIVFCFWALGEVMGHSHDFEGSPHDGQQKHGKNVLTRGEVRKIERTSKKMGYGRKGQIH